MCAALSQLLAPRVRDLVEAAAMALTLHFAGADGQVRELTRGP